ncbi:MAG TPA: sigma factor-like helix-turn-helix DNA-binding protein [Bryobacteraceae bacterium]|nr:sigma factor-like helix-turn-helix DNA-binding protein [Bryobacteraceae bacterium]
MTDETAQPKRFGEKPLKGAVSQELLERVGAADESAISELSRLLSPGLRLLIRRRIGPEGVDERVRETLQDVIEGIRRNSLRNPDELPAFVREILQARMARHIEPAPLSLRQDSPDSVRAMREVLESLPALEREALTRFYVLEQPVEQVAVEMGVSAEDLRAIKIRAKELFLQKKQEVEAAAEKDA